MEPGLRDRENVTQGNVREAVRTGRNGARPERPGKRRIRGGTCPAQVRRNGARPERPGKLECRGDHPTDRDAAMEPGLRDPENRQGRAMTGGETEPQWSPAGETGKTRRRRKRNRRRRRPQWSPA